MRTMATKDCVWNLSSHWQIQSLKSPLSPNFWTNKHVWHSPVDCRVNLNGKLHLLQTALRQGQKQCSIIDWYIQFLRRYTCCTQCGETYELLHGCTHPPVRSKRVTVSRFPQNKGDKLDKVTWYDSGFRQRRCWRSPLIYQ